MANDYYIDDDHERASEEEAAEAYKEYLWERDFVQNNARIAGAWNDLVAECDMKRKELKEAA